MAVQYNFSLLATPTGSIFPLGQDGEVGGPLGSRPAILDLNESGEYVGRLIEGDDTLRAFSSTDGNFNIGQVNSQALGINDNNVVVGQRPDQFSTLGGFQSSPDGSINNAPSPSNGGVFDSAAFDINNDGVNVGQSIGGSPYRANLDGNFIQELTDDSGVAYDINEFNQVVGQSGGRAFFTNQNIDSEAIDLGTLRGDNQGISSALAVNDFSNSAGDFIEFVGESSIEGDFDAPLSSYDESIDGELSIEQASPTPISLSAGSNIITGSTSNDPLDRDFFTFTVPEGATVSEIVLQNYQWGDGNQSIENYGDSYFALTEGNSVPSISNDLETDSEFDVSKLIDNFAAEESEVGQDLLEPGVGKAASGNNRLGSGELGPGTYTVWYQETGANTTYTFNVVLDTPPTGVTHAAYGQVISFVGEDEPFLAEFVSDLGTLSSDDATANSVAYDINRNFFSSEGQGKIVGSSDTDSGDQHAFVVFDNDLTTMFDLNDLIIEGDSDFFLPGGNPAFTLLEATAINDDGVIVGTGLLNTNKVIEFEDGEVGIGLTNDLFGFRLTPEEVIAPPAILEVGLYDAESDTLITLIEEGDEVPASLLDGEEITISAVVPDDSALVGQVESIFLDLNSGKVTKTENIEPYALFGDSPQGDFNGNGLVLEESNTIAFDLYNQDNLAGTLLDTVTRNFTIVDDLTGPSGLIVGIYDADSDELIAPLINGSVIDASSLADKSVTIAATVPESSIFTGQVESMQLNLNDGAVIQTENIEPYALFGDSPKGDFSGGSVPTGENTIAFNLYSDNMLKGDLLDTVNIDFTIAEV